MTAPRGKVSASLASRGRPENWANEAEAAVLSGVGVETFRAKVKAWESRGFPQINPENGKRSIPAILAFWGLPLNHSAGPVPVTSQDDEDGQEKWNEPGQSQRRAS